MPEETLRLIAVFLGALIPTATAVGVFMWRIRDVFSNFISALERPTSKVEENTNALNSLTNALNSVIELNAQLREELRLVRQDRDTLARRVESLDDTTAHLIRTDRERQEASQKRDKEMISLFQQVGTLNSDLYSAKKSLKECQDEVAVLRGRNA